MVYSIWADGVCIHHDAYLQKGHKVLSPKLTMEDSAAGSLTMTVPPINVGYSSVQRLSSEIVVKRDGEEIWSGRVIGEKQGFHNSRVLTCEGELAYLNDTIQPPAEYRSYSVRGLLEAVIAVHNSMSEKRFTVGSVTVTDLPEDEYRYTNYETTLDFIREILLGKHGGHIRVRKVNGVRYLDYLSDWADTNSQTIRFGTNLLDFTRNWDSTTLATAILPRGARLENVFEYEHAVTSVRIQRGLSDDSHFLPNTWSTSETYTNGMYLWERIKMTLRNGETEYSQPKIIISPTITYKAVKANANTNPSSHDWFEKVNGDYIGTSDTTVDTTKTYYTRSVSIGGKSGVQSVRSQYYLSSSRSDTEDGQWLETVPAFQEDHYYFCRSMITWSDGTSSSNVETCAKSAVEDTNQHPDDYLTVASVNDGDIYVRSPEAIQTYGWIARIVDFDDVTVATNLLERGQAYLTDSQFEKLVLELKAVDLHYLNPEIEAISLLDRIRCVSPPHGMDRYFPVTKIEIPLDKPENTSYILGLEMHVSLTSATVRAQTSADTASNRATSAAVSSKQSFRTLSANQELILEEAKSSAASLINQAVNGYITVVQGPNHSESLVISDASDYTKATRYWVWNINGLGYTSDGGNSFGVAMTMDGAIVADFITAGTLNAGIIRAGIIRDAAGTNFWNLETGEFQLTTNTRVLDPGSSSYSNIVTVDSVTAQVTNATQKTVVATDVEYGNSDSESTNPVLWTSDANWVQGKYLWTRVKMTLKDNTIEYSQPKKIAGTTGLGVASVVEEYYLSTSDRIRAGGSWSETQPDWVDGRYYWTHSKITWSDGSVTYTPDTPAKALTSGNQSTNDLSRALTQQEIFNRLTNNGQSQGIYLQHGRLYINAEYLVSGTIASRSGDVKWDLDAGTLWTEEYWSEYADGGTADIYASFSLVGGGLTLSWRRNRSGALEHEIGSSHLTVSNDDADIKGWAFDLEEDGDYLAWSDYAGTAPNGAKTYNYVMMYARNDIDIGVPVRGGAITFFCDIDMTGHRIFNASI